jgi:hypothetical protein
MHVYGCPYLQLLRLRLSTLSNATEFGINVFEHLTHINGSYMIAVDSLFVCQSGP